MSIGDFSDQTLPSPPFIEVEGVPNFRDLGGYPISPSISSHTSSSCSTRRRHLFRCGEPSKITPSGIATLKALGVTTIYDLRSTNEIEHGVQKGRGGIREWEGCKRVHVPVFRDLDYSPEGMAQRYGNIGSNRQKREGDVDKREESHEGAVPQLEKALQNVFQHMGDTSRGGSEGFMKAYSDILEHGAPAYRTILLHLANEPSNPLAVHCTGGKDRAGILCALVLAICGVNDEIIAQEYSLTESGMPEEWKKATIARLMENPALQDNRDGAINMLSAKPATMMAFIKLLKEQYGGVEGYIIEKCGLTKEEAEKIRKNMIEDVPAIQRQA